jgi:hypothetical protein
MACGGSITLPPVPAVPVAAAPQGQLVPLKNPSFAAGADGQIEFWEANEHSRGHSFTFVADPKDAYSLPTSARINRYGDEAWGLLRQMVPVQPAWLNKTIRLTGFLRTDAVDSFGAAVLVQSRSASDDVLTWDHMNDRRLLGTRPWSAVSVQIKIPPNAAFISAGVMLEGGGTLWADDLRLEIID